MVFPPPGTVPANDTTPEAGAATEEPEGAPTSTPRCCPAAYGSSPNRKGRSTSPCTGHVQPNADAGNASMAEIAKHTSNRIGNWHLVVS